MNTRLLSVVTLTGLITCSCSAVIQPTLVVSPIPSTQTVLSSESPAPIVSETWEPGADDLTQIAQLADNYSTEVAAFDLYTPGPYWLPDTTKLAPIGGWHTYVDNEFGFSFEYPANYDTGPCGKPIVAFVNGATQLRFDQGAISITIAEVGTDELQVYVEKLIAERKFKLLSTVGDFSIDGRPAFRLVRSLGDVTSSQYAKMAFVLHDGKLFSYTYALMDFVWCDAKPLSEEMIYEHIIATWQFSQ